MTWNKDSIHALLDSKPQAVVRALIAIYERQTEDEKATHATKLHNGVGFSAFDAEFCTDLAKKAKRGWTLSPKQLAVARNKMKRYWRQLAEIANAKEALAVQPAPKPAIPLEPNENDPTGSTWIDHNHGGRLCDQHGVPIDGNYDEVRVARMEIEDSLVWG